MVDDPPSSGRESEGRLVLRSVQRTGRSSLAVTLPKSWTDSLNVHTGSMVRLHDVGEGRLEVSLVRGSSEEPEHAPLLLDATGCPSALLSRLLVGAYITGQDHVVITSSGELSRDLRAEVGRTAQRVLGMSLIEDESNRLEVRVFLDPTKHRLAGLLDRVVRMIRLELELCQQALETGDRSPLQKVTAVEEEIDRFYLLMARQILLASNDFQVAREIGVPSHHYQLGYRIVVKMLEVTADLLATVAGDLSEHLEPGKDAAELRRELTEFDATLQATMEAFRTVSASRAHDALCGIEAWNLRQSESHGPLIGRSRDKLGAARLQRILSSLGTARELLAIVNETTINRSVEPETIARAGGHPLRARLPPAPEPRARTGPAVA